MGGILRPKKSSYIKDFLRYKKITSQNGAKVKKVFLFRRKVMLPSQVVQVFVFLNIPWFTKSMTSSCKVLPRNFGKMKF